jgi:Glycosyl transferase family 2
MSDRPTVSVVLRTYEHAAFLTQAIESVLIQDLEAPFELVIGEDCSTDGTREIVERYAARHPETIRPVLPERNVGHGEIFKRALAATRGSFIAYLDGDDYWSSASKLRRQLDFLQANPDCTSCFHDVSLVYGDAGTPSGAINPALSEERFELEDILLECFVPAPAVMFRRSVAERLPAWAFDVPWIDWLIHICAASLGSIGYLPLTMAAYRVHPGGMFSALDRITQIEADFPFYERLASELPEHRSLLERCVAFRHCELAIERLGVSFDACVVLIDPRREMRPYFNGRHARSLPRLEARAVTELDAIRRAAARLSTADPHFESPIQTLDGQGGCYVVVPADAASWVEGHRGLVGYLGAEAQVAWSDEWCTVHALPLRSGERRPPSVRVDVLLARPLPAALSGCFLEAPASGDVMPAHVVSITGWALGREAEVVAIEFEAAGRVLWRTPSDVERPDVLEALPEGMGRTPGFQTALNVSDGEAAVDLVAVFANGERATFASLACDPVAANEAAGSPA